MGRPFSLRVGGRIQALSQSYNSVYAAPEANKGALGCVDNAAHLDVRFFAPPGDLAGCFTTFYRLELTGPPNVVVHDALQPEWGNLRFFHGKAPNAWFANGSQVSGCRFQATGPSSQPARFALRPARMWGIGLLPLGWARFVATDASMLANTVSDGERSPAFARFTPLCAHLCRAGTDEDQFAAITEFFRQLAPPPPDEARIVAAHAAMTEPHIVQVGELAEKAGMTRRTLERICQRHFGFPPRLLLRRQRLMRSLAAFMLGDGASWSDVIDRHYHDQSHFVHEFHSFMGLSPSEYAAQPHPILSAFMSERQRIWGSPVQTLDRPAI